MSPAVEEPAKRPPRTRDKLTMAALKLQVERRVELVEKLVEARAEKVWEECMEKRPWLQPIETWIMDRHKARLKAIEEHQGRGYSSDSEISTPPRKMNAREVRDLLAAYMRLLRALVFRRRKIRVPMD